MTDVPRLNALDQPVRASHVRIPADIATSADYERHAIHHIEASAWRHIQDGVDQGLTLAHNRYAFDRLRLVPRPLATLSGGHTRGQLLGQPIRHPLLLAPIAHQCLAHPDGELASVRAAMALQCCFVASTLANHSLEQIAATAQAASEQMGHGAPLWFQLYSQPTRSDTLALVRRAEAAGYGAIVWTIDAAVKRSGFALPAGVFAANLVGAQGLRHTSQAGQDAVVLGTALADLAPTWAELDWLRSQTKLALIVKGILSPVHAREVVARGADALVLSNHGGRVLDGVVSPIEVLAETRRLVADTPLIVDSGIRWGSDIVKALALGANAVLIGRPLLHALAVGGLAGVAHLIHLLRTELELAMAQLGCATIDQITPDLLFDAQHRSP